MKKVLPLAIAAALAVPAAAMADATVYGKIHVAYDLVDSGVQLDDDNLDYFSYDDSVAYLNSHNSRLGIKGSEDLTDGLKAVYQMEFGVDVTDNVSGGQDLFSARNMYVGLAGGFGTALFGRYDTPLKVSQGKFDLFNDTYADMKRVIPGEDRLGNVGAYISPEWAGFTFLGAMVAGELGDGTPDELTSIADHYSLAGLYSNGPFYGALAYNSYDLGVYDANPSMWRATFVFQNDMFQVGAIYNSFDFDTSGLGDSDAWGLNGAFTFAGNNTIKAEYLQGDSPVIGIDDIYPGFTPNVQIPNPVEDEVTQWTLGYEYGFSKRTSLYANYNNYDVDSLSDAEGTFSLGMIHSF